MSFKEFKPTKWSDKVFSQYRDNLVMLPLTTREYEGEITASGQRVKINEIGKVTTKDYVKGTDIVYEELEDASKYLDIDQQKYTALKIEDIDRAQATPDLMNPIVEEMGISMAESVESFLMTLGYTDSTSNIITGTEASPTSITSANIIQYLEEAGTAMSDANVPKQGRVCVLPNWMAGKITLADIAKNTDNSKTLQIGYVGDYMGFSVYESNNVIHSGTTWYAPIFFRAQDTIAFASQITSSKALEDKDSFSDLMRMLNVYGAKTVRPSSLFSMRVAKGAET